jgi:hypothetical protein
MCIVAREGEGGVADARGGRAAQSRPSGRARRAAPAAVALCATAWTRLALAQAAPAPAPLPSARGDTAPPAPPAMLSTLADERRRLADLLGDGHTDGLMLRASSIAPYGPTPPRAARPARAAGAAAAAAVTPPEFAPFADAPTRLRAVLPLVRTTWNSAIPFGGNDAALWAGRGVSALVRGGLVAERGRVRAQLLPEIAISQNRAFPFRPTTAPGYSPFASPWYVPPSEGAPSADVPTRFGDRPYGLVTLGQSAVRVRAGGTDFGFSTENEWWGPAVRNALFLSDNAEGFPHLYARTARPLRTRLGVLEARWLVGTLTRSLYYDTTSTPQYRSFSGLAVTLRPAPVPHLTVGVERTVITDIGGAWTRSLGRSLDALWTWTSDVSKRIEADQLFGGFVRYVLPEDHVEVYAEYARSVTPANPRELLVVPQDGQGYTVGAQVARPVSRLRGLMGAAPVVRVQAEATNLEQSVTIQQNRWGPPPFYTGFVAPGGYTHRGQVLGAAIGPSGQSQWLATDLLGGERQLGLFVGRIRWNNDALYQQPGANFFRHDASVYAGARAATRVSYADVRAEFYWAKRYNYEFQNGRANPGGRRTVDVKNLTLRLDVTPR